MTPAIPEEQRDDDETLDEQTVNEMLYQPSSPFYHTDEALTMRRDAGIREGKA